MILLRYNKENPKTNTFSDCVTTNKITSMASERINIKLSTWKFNKDEENGNHF